LTPFELPWWWVHAAVLLAAYVLGSVPFSYLVARHKGVDVRTVGSGNVGATNVMRSAGRAAGVLAFLLDFAKGAAATALAVRLIGGATMPAAAAVLAVVGHMYPVWLRFRGGKGVATGAGAFLPVAPAATVGALAVFAGVLLVSRYVSAASIAGTVSLSGMAYLTGRPHPIPLSAAALAALIVWKHRDNLRRLFRGTESRLGRASSTPSVNTP
jgi:acyl phosphate:glycerol-3-phosphate acyltransferase